MDALIPNHLAYLFRHSRVIRDLLGLVPQFVEIRQRLVTSEVGQLHVELVLAVQSREREVARSRNPTDRIGHPHLRVHLKDIKFGVIRFFRLLDGKPSLFHHLEKSLHVLCTRFTVEQTRTRDVPKRIEEPLLRSLAVARTRKFVAHSVHVQPHENAQLQFAVRRNRLHQRRNAVEVEVAGENGQRFRHGNQFPQTRAHARLFPRLLVYIVPVCDEHGFLLKTPLQTSACASSSRLHPSVRSASVPYHRSSGSLRRDGRLAGRSPRNRRPA